MSAIKHLMELAADAELAEQEAEDFMVHARGSSIDISLMYPHVVKLPEDIEEG